jgi:hypothetical protein
MNNLIAPGDALYWNRPQLGKRYEATVTENGAIVLSDGRTFSSPSRAAVVAADIPAADGWYTWRVERLAGKSLDDLRRDLAASPSERSPSGQPADLGDVTSQCRVAAA